MTEHKCTGPVSAEELSKLFTSGEVISFISITANENWCWYLIGRIITCPICGRKAVIVPADIEIPIEKNSDIPCHCAVDLDNGEIFFHWCAKINGNKVGDYFSIVFNNIADFHVYYKSSEKFNPNAYYNSLEKYRGSPGTVESTYDYMHRLLKNRDNDTCKLFKILMKISCRI